MTTIPATRSIEHGLPYNTASTRSSLTMATMITTLTILGKSNWNKTEIYQILWMWWRMQQTDATTMTQTMMTATTTTLMRKKIPKTKRIPILPTHKWRMGAMARDCPIGVEIGIGVCCCCCCCVHQFSQTLVKVCVVLVCGCFFGVFS